MRDTPLRMILFVVILGTLLSAVILVVNAYTAPRIARNSELTIKRNVLEAQGISSGPQDVEQVFERNIDVVRKGEKTYYVLKNGDIAFEFAGNGLWGPIHGVISLESDLRTIKRIMIIHQEETAGLGGRLAERSYLRNFDAKKFSPTIEIVNRRKAEKDNEVDGITGATMTSKAFERLINGQVGEYVAAYGGR
jgi:Na+-transporting NADH:ubiquinone oxidoreductase subunit C